MEQQGPRISRSALARMTGATALGLAVAPEVAAARGAVGAHRHMHHSDVLADGRAGDVGMDAEALEDAFARIARRAADGRFPGAVALVARRGIVVGERAFGVRLAGSTEATTTDTLYDLESMTKVLATATAAMILVHRGKLSLTAPVAKYLPHFAANGKGGVLVRDLLRYSSGLPDRQPEGRHRRRRRDLALHGGDVARVPDRLDGRVLRPRLPPARAPRRGRGRHGSRHVREAARSGARSGCRTRPTTRRRRSPRAARPRGRARSTSGPARCADPCRTTRTGRSAASSAATARSRPPATSRSSAR